MKANEKNILRFLEISDTKFIVPIYQRRYSWKIEDAKRLFDDLVFCIKNNYKDHFFGSIVTAYNDKSRNREYIIIDGQQRIASISLILICLYKLSNDENMKERILNQYLINKYQDDFDKFKLKLGALDYDDYKMLLEMEEIKNITNLSINYSYFYNRILKGEVNIKEIFEALKSLNLVEIELNAVEDDSHIIFDSLNSTGVSLTISDKVKNYIFLGKSKEEQEILYGKYYLPIEKRVGQDITAFLHSYLMIKEERVVSITRLYESFKAYTMYNNIDSKELLKDLEDYSVYYSKIYENDFDANIYRHITDIHMLAKNSTQCLLIIVIKQYMTQKITQVEFEQILLVMESYLFRRVICKISNNILSKFFLNLAMEVHKSSEGVAESFKMVILKQVDTLRFPRDIEFKRCFFECEIYFLSSDKRIYMLEKLENFDNKEFLDIRTLCTKGIIQIEHIMPKKLSREWIQSLGEDYKEIHSKYVHTIGNLTLTGYNPNMSNKGFLQKRDMKNGFKESRLKLNRYIAMREDFTEREIIERALILFEEAKKIWPVIKTKYKINQKTKKLYYLSDDINLDNYKVDSFIFEGVLYNAKSFKDVFDSVINILYDIEPLGIKTLCKNALKIKFAEFKISDSFEMVKNGYEIVNGIYADEKMSNLSKVIILKEILNIYNIEYDELSFYLI